MKCKAKETIDRFGMLRTGHVLLALSGGMDSMALLYLLKSLQTEYAFELEAAHVNHCLRGDESDRDEKFVRDTCRMLEVPLHVLKVDVAKEAANSGEGIEECGRRIRYSFFDSLKKGEIATAHHLNDQAETVLLHLTRGSGLRGLCGIAPVHDGIIRPLISCSRSSIESFCSENNIPYITDSTNASDDYARNRVRHHVVHKLTDLNPAFLQSVDRCVDTLREDNSFLEACAEDLLLSAKCKFGFQVDAFRKAHPSIRRRAIEILLRAKMMQSPTYDHIHLCEAMLLDGGAVQTEQDVKLCAYGGILYFEKPLRDAWKSDISDGKANLPFGSAKIDILYNENIQNVHKPDLAKYICCDTITSDVYFRSRKPGDSMRRVNSECTKTIKKLMEENGIPDCYRNDIPILTDGERVLWIEGIGCASDLAVTSESRKIMRIDILRGN